MRPENHNIASNMPLFLALLPISPFWLFCLEPMCIFEDDSSYGSNQMALLIAALVAGGIGMFRGISWSSIRDAISNNISQATEAILILLLIGSCRNVAACRYYSCIYTLWITIT